MNDLSALATGIGYIFIFGFSVFMIFIMVFLVFFHTREAYQDNKFQGGRYRLRFFYKLILYICLFAFALAVGPVAIFNLGKNYGAAGVIPGMIIYIGSLWLIAKWEEKRKAQS